MNYFLTNKSVIDSKGNKIPLDTLSLDTESLISLTKKFILFQKQEESQILFPVYPSELLLTKSEEDLQCSFVIPSQLNQNYKDQISHFSLEIKNLIPKHLCTASICLICYVIQQQMIVAVCRLNEIKYFNIFTFKTEIECLYFANAAYKQAALDSEIDPVYFFGQISSNSSIANLFRSYFRMVEFPAESKSEL